MPPKRDSVAAYEAPYIDFATESFGGEATRKVIDAIGSSKMATPSMSPSQRASLTRALNDAAALWRARERAERTPTRLQLRHHVERIEATASALRALLPIVEEETGWGNGFRKEHRLADSLEEALTPLVAGGLADADHLEAGRGAARGAEPLATPSQDPAIWLAETADRIAKLQRIAAAFLSEVDAARSGTGDARGSATTALISFIERLATIYEQAFGRPAGISRPSDGGPAGGPAIRFIQAALVVAGADARPDTVASALRRRRRARGA